MRHAERGGLNQSKRECILIILCVAPEYSFGTSPSTSLLPQPFTYSVVPSLGTVSHHLGRYHHLGQISIVPQCVPGLPQNFVGIITDIWSIAMPRPLVMNSEGYKHSPLLQFVPAGLRKPKWPEQMKLRVGPLSTKFWERIGLIPPRNYLIYRLDPKDGFGWLRFGENHARCETEIKSNLTIPSDGTTLPPSVEAISEYFKQSLWPNAKCFEPEVRIYTCDCELPSTALGDSTGTYNGHARGLQFILAYQSALNGAQTKCLTLATTVGTVGGSGLLLVKTYIGLWFWMHRLALGWDSTAGNRFYVATLTHFFFLIWNYAGSKSLGPSSSVEKGIAEHIKNSNKKRHSTRGSRRALGYKNLSF
ncbi:hypothetical protein B0H10DRAFT_2202720 [Mycena sp. CBHHK59/15]|nr:hypothetical protein B0H10DRAFT_2202720 [Mycena sp. CBHHK59/15]